MTNQQSRWTRLKSTLLLDCLPWFRVFTDNVELPGGRQIEGFLRIESRPYAVVFAVTDDGQVIFVDGYKYGPNRNALQLPAGYLEDGEEPEGCARRELLEETGYEARTWEYMGNFCPDGNRGFGQAHFFLARGAHARKQQELDEMENLTVRAVSIAQVQQLLSGEQFGELTAITGIALALARLGTWAPKAPYDQPPKP